MDVGSMDVGSMDVGSMAVGSMAVGSMAVGSMAVGHGWTLTKSKFSSVAKWRKLSSIGATSTGIIRHSQLAPKYTHIPAA